MDQPHYDSNCSDSSILINSAQEHNTLVHHSTLMVPTKKLKLMKTNISPVTMEELHNSIENTFPENKTSNGTGSKVSVEYTEQIYDAFNRILIAQVEPINYVTSKRGKRKENPTKRDSEQILSYDQNSPESNQKSITEAPLIQRIRKKHQFNSCYKCATCGKIYLERKRIEMHLKKFPEHQMEKNQGQNFEIWDHLVEITNFPSLKEAINFVRKLVPNETQVDAILTETLHMQTKKRNSRLKSTHLPTPEMASYAIAAGLFKLSATATASASDGIIQLLWLFK
ncbi:hypothetical protein ABEB36_011249 [Hypothenemus hampei]|uniref:C2H2-type domain-containing protein n=1 Tax=Hypothenemus hampei TaxID=57062 RepID=A0ABD1EHK2_HYPHA